MLRGRIPQNAAKLRRAVSSCVESLEERRLLTTLFAESGQPALFDYLDAGGERVRIQVTSTRFVGEFLALRVTGDDDERLYPTNTLIMRDLIPTPPDPDDDFDGADLFNVYITEATPDTRIMISRIEVNDDGEVEALPYEGNAGPIKVFPNNGGQLIEVTPGGNGEVYIGARLLALENSDAPENLPITSQRNNRAYGVRPATRVITAGIETAQGISLDRILVAGTITGRVYIAGSVDTFYAGNIVTGNTEGLAGASNITKSHNFFVGGDLRNLLVDGSVGTHATDPGLNTTFKTTYYAGTDFLIGGKLGNVRVGGTLLASVEVLNAASAANSLNTPFAEVETGALPNETDLDTFFPSLLFPAGGRLTLGTLSNDATGYSAYSIKNTVTGEAGTFEFTGEINTQANVADSIDSYAIPLMGGQTVTIQLASLNLLQVGIFDPFGRLVATDLPDLRGAGQNERFRFTTKTPGIYRLAVVPTNDPTFTGVGSIGAATYRLRVQNAGETAVGRIHADGNMLLGQVTFNANFIQVPSLGLRVRTGDVGAVTSGQTFMAPLLAPVQVSRGNLRVLEAGAIGTTNIVPNAPDLYVPRGSVGYLHSLGLLAVNTSAINFDDDVVPTSAIGFDYERVEATGNILGNLIANRSIGTVVAASVDNTGTIFLNSHFYANADDSGEDGTIDLIDITGAFNRVALRTGAGGNVKYIRAGSVIRDPFFGFNIDSQVSLDPGESYRVTDDSGARALIRPTTIIPRGAAVGTIGALDLTLYGVRDSGGVVVVNLDSTTGVEVIGLGNSGQFDIGTISSVFTAATPVTYDAVRNQVGYPPATGTIVGRIPTTALNFTFAGRVPVNVLDIIKGATPPPMHVSTIDNLTSGEIASTTIDGSLGFLNAQSIGVKSTTRSEVMVAANFTGEPATFDQFSFGVTSGGSMIQIAAREGISFVATSGDDTAIGSVIANSDGRDDRSLFEGITGVISSNYLVRVDVGEGLAFGGTGNVIFGGIIANDYEPDSPNADDAEITQIIARNADLRGLIASEGNIRDIYVQDGSIIGARILSTTTQEQILYTYAGGYTFPDRDTEVRGAGTPAAAVSTTTQIAYGLDTVRVRGNGGILGTEILVSDFKVIDVSGGFGIIGSFIGTTAANNPNGVLTTDGLGIRDVTVQADTSINLIEARGQGQRLNILKYSPNVRLSESGKRFDPFSGRLFSLTNDLHTAIGTSKTRPRVSGLTNAGIIENLVAVGNDTLRSLKAYALRADPVSAFATTSSQYPSRISFANSIGSFEIAHSIQGLQLTTGRLDNFVAGGNLEYTNISVAGPIKKIVVGGNVRGTSSIVAKGPDGQLQSLYVRRYLGGSVQSNLSINSLDAGHIGGSISTLNSIANLRVRGDVVAGAYIRATRNINTLYVGGDVQEGATIRAKMFGTRTILGETNGTIVTG